MVNGLVARERYNPTHRLAEPWIVAARLVPDLKKNLLQYIFRFFGIVKNSEGDGKKQLGMLVVEFSESRAVTCASGAEQFNVVV